MDENVDDLEKAVKLIATIAVKNLDNENSNEETFERAELKPGDFNLSEESSEKLSQLLKSVLQAKVRCSIVWNHADSSSILLIVLLSPKDNFDVVESDGKENERFIFLFKSRMFLTEINKNISESERTYNVKKIIKVHVFNGKIAKEFVHNNDLYKFLR